MVQTIAVSEATLMDDVTAFLMEDPDSINTATNWWHPRVKVLEKWLREDANRAAMPDDGMEDMIRRHIKRGDIHAHVQLKCWKHILLELSDISCLTASTRSDMAGECTSTSPSRGKLRPGKELIILSDEINQETSHSDSAPPISDDGGTSLKCYSSPQPAGNAVNDTVAANPSSKKFAGLSMMERQAEWLRKKQEKLAAEKQRQDEEKEKELTFQPKIIRRATYGSDNPATEDRKPAPARSMARSDSLKSPETATNTSNESRRPTSGNIVARRGSAKPGKRKKYISVTEKLEIQSNLLDSMKSELEASMMRTAPLAMSPQRIAGDNAEHDARSQVDAPTAGPEVSLASDASPDQPTGELKTWSQNPVISGFRVDFDSSGTKARLVLQDASKFELSSMYRKTDRKAQRDGVALHMGRREDTYEEEVIAILFDTEKVSESDAAKWWAEHEHRFAQYVRDRSSNAASSALASAVAALTSS